MQDGTVGSGMWERAARNLFRVQMRLGMFDPDSELPYRQWGVEKVRERPRQDAQLLFHSNDVTIVFTPHVLVLVSTIADRHQ